MPLVNQKRHNIVRQPATNKKSNQKNQNLCCSLAAEDVRASVGAGGLRRCGIEAQHLTNVDVADDHDTDWDYVNKEEKQPAKHLPVVVIRPTLDAEGHGA